MEALQTYAALAEIFGAVTIIGGGLIGFIQLREFRARRRQQIASDLCREFTKPELARAVTLVRSMPDGISLEELQKLGPEYQDAAQMLGMTFESMGLLVHKDIASFDVVQELTGGLLLMMWRKIGHWVVESRVEQEAPRFGEWMQWLMERVQECEADLEPAHVKHKNWNRHLK
ncbi:MAG: hypothetical protein GKR90_24235 [Pseudomonadales bacterium]|nr:hypothetical protein [Pseudomonadales bacterium]